ncbi:hypothetical protein FKW77_008017 [Venturia effusa]|uniref:Glycine zipper 2TM domain-containing protein n=1 Tax=Venturia effusa TaxID=50376 RepID=A0A517L9N4_9PEZI|nr:hypothetical protein FKW77_008017 [Venturia effusa]
MPEQNAAYPGIPAIDIVHDLVYDRAYKPYRDHRQKKKKAPQPPSDEMSDGVGGSTFDGIVKNRPNFAPGDGYLPGDSPYAPPTNNNNSNAGGTGGAGSVRGGAADTERYEPSSYGRQAASDGYARDGYSDQYEERGVWGGSAVKGKGYSKGYKQPKTIGYGGQYDRRTTRSYDNLSEAEYYQDRDNRRRAENRYAPPEPRYYRDERDERDDRDDSRDRGDFPRPRRGSSRNGYGYGYGRGGGGRSPSRSDSEGSDHHNDGGDENTQVKKWGATIAGAAIGGFTGHKAKKDSGLLGTAIGAIVGGLVAREAEKEIYKRKGRNKSRRREEEGSYRSMSR